MYIMPWKMHFRKMNGMNGGVGDHLAPYISLGDNFVVNLEDGNLGVDFYILMCTKTTFTFKQPFKCPWGQKFNAGDMAVAGKYHQMWGNLGSSYVPLRKSQTTHVHVCHVKAIKFPMFLADHRVQGNDLVYKLLEHAEDGIRQAIATIDL
jgi:hypothetical protein